MLRSPTSSITRAALVLLLAASTLAACSDGAAEDTSAAAQERSAASAPSTPRPMIGTAWVIFGTDTIVAEVARSDAERAEGLMYREEVPDGTGMLFVFPDVAPRSFWMQNTYVALDIAYMDENMRILNIEALEPLNTTSVPSAGPAQYALEVRQGWFGERGIQVGHTPTIVFP